MCVSDCIVFVWNEYGFNLLLLGTGVLQMGTFLFRMSTVVLQKGTFMFWMGMCVF